jgi:hypothetical protein
MSQISLLGVLPEARPVVVLDIERRPDADLWDQVFVWGVVYLTNKTYSVFDHTRILLFSIGS